MKFKNLLVGTILVVCTEAGWMTLHADTMPGLQWDQAFGGSSANGLQSVQQTSDGGYILGGYSNSAVSGNKSAAGFGGYDFWLVRLDAQGSQQWDRAFGGTGFEVMSSLQQTADGGYILGGYSTSGISGNKSANRVGGYDYWLVKVDATGVKQWDRVFGGSGSDFLIQVRQTDDGGYLLGGYSDSGVSGSKSVASFGQTDYWVVKVDANGIKQWDKAFGGSGFEILTYLRSANGGGYWLGGYSDSGVSGNKTNANFGQSDYWVVKLDANGNKQWDKALGGNDLDELYSLLPTDDGGCVLGGASRSGVSGNKTNANVGQSDYWVVKLDAGGNKLWERTLGGTNNDVQKCLQAAGDGGYLLAGNSFSKPSGNKTSERWGRQDYWVVKLSADGDKQWDQSFGGAYTEGLESLYPTTDGGYILGGYSNSGVSGNKASAPLGDTDGWLVKVGPVQAPVITSQPSSQAVMAGTNVTLSVTATAAEPLFYQWQHGGEHLMDQTNASLSWSNFQATNEGAYSVIVRGASGSVRSANAFVLIHLPMRFHLTTLGENGFQAYLVGSAGTNYVLSASTNLMDWTALQTNQATNDFLIFSDTNAPNLPRRFYRVREQP